MNTVELNRTLSQGYPAGHEGLYRLTKTILNPRSHKAKTHFSSWPVWPEGMLVHLAERKWLNQKNEERGDAGEWVVNVIHSPSVVGQKRAQSKYDLRADLYTYAYSAEKVPEDLKGKFTQNSMDVYGSFLRALERTTEDSLSVESKAELLLSMVDYSAQTVLEGLLASKLISVEKAAEAVLNWLETEEM